MMVSITGFSQNAEKVVIIIIDGARYSETLGDLTKTYTPKMWGLAEQGAMVDNFYNDQYTYTSRAIPALWCGAWTDVHDTVYQGHSTQYSVLPSIFEYFRKQQNAPAEDCYYVLKEIESLWLPSFNPDYGPDYWPTFHSVGNTDEDVAAQALQVMDDHHPQLLWVYFADVDHAGHSGNWSNYIGAIQTADSLVDVLWNAIQTDPFYQDNTTMIVTNDHGRHDDQHGGFSGHGDGCDGCRHIQLLAIGPNVKTNFISYQNRNTPDMAVTAAYLLEVDAEWSTGNVMSELFSSSNLNESTSEKLLGANYPNPFNTSTEISYTVFEKSTIKFSILNSSGENVRILINEMQVPGEKMIRWDGRNSLGEKVAQGVYFYLVESGSRSEVGKMVYLPAY